jgi:hypothetical protein
MELKKNPDHEMNDLRDYDVANTIEIRKLQRMKLFRAFKEEGKVWTSTPVWTPAHPAAALDLLAQVGGAQVRDKYPPDKRDSLAPGPPNGPHDLDSLAPELKSLAPDPPDVNHELDSLAPELDSTAPDPPDPPAEHNELEPLAPDTGNDSEDQAVGQGRCRVVSQGQKKKREDAGSRGDGQNVAGRIVNGRVLRFLH